MKQAVKIFVHVSTKSYSAGELTIWQCDMSDHGYHLLSVQDIELDVPEFDVVQIQVDGIDSEIVEIRAKAQVKINQLERRKQELLAIGHDSIIEE